MKPVLAFEWPILLLFFPQIWQLDIQAAEAAMSSTTSVINNVTNMISYCDLDEHCSQFELDTSNMTFLGDGGEALIFSVNTTHFAPSEKVIIKCMAKASDAEREASFLHKIQGLDGSVKYYGTAVIPKELFSDIANVTTLVNDTDQHAIIMEHFDVDLLYYKNQVGTIDVKELETVTRQVLKFMAGLHELEIIHLDLKMGNILLRYNTTDMCIHRCAITDFGISLTSGEAVNARAERGTVGYRSPEAKLGQYTKKYDVYSFGKVLFQLLQESNAIPRRMYKKDSRYYKFTEMIEECTQEDPKLRPTFHQLYIRSQSWDV